MKHLTPAALSMLQELVADLERGRAAVVSLQVEYEDEAERVLAIRWVPAAGVPVQAPAPKPSRCRACGAGDLWLTQHNTLVCPACGETADG